MSKIIVYSKEGFEGRSDEFKHDVRDLEDDGISNVIRSIKVIGNPWVAYYDKDYAGKQRVFEEGKYATLDDKVKLSSLKMVSDDLANPEIQLFEDIYYKGRSVTIRDETNLQDIQAFGDKASSHRVKSGVWVLYEHINRRGSQLISFPGQEVPSYKPLTFNDVASCVRPLLPNP